MPRATEILTEYLDRNVRPEHFAQHQLGFLYGEDPQGCTDLPFNAEQQDIDAAAARWDPHRSYLRSLEPPEAALGRTALLGPIRGEFPLRDVRFMNARIRQACQDVGPLDAELQSAAQAFAELCQKHLDHWALTIEETTRLHLAYERTMRLVAIARGADHPSFQLAVLTAGMGTMVVADATSGGAAYVEPLSGPWLGRSTREALHEVEYKHCSRKEVDKRLQAFAEAMYSRAGTQARARQVTIDAGNAAFDVGEIVSAAVRPAVWSGAGAIWDTWTARTAWDRGVALAYAHARKELWCGDFLGHPKSGLHDIARTKGVAKAERLRDWTAGGGQVRLTTKVRLSPEDDLEDDEFIRAYQQRQGCWGTLKRSLFW